MPARIITAIFYAVTTGVGLWQTTQPANVEAWVGVVLAALVAGWGKFSHPDTIVSANK